MTATVLVLPIDFVNDNGGRTQHFGASKVRRRQYEATIRLLYAKPQPIPTPVTMTITRVLGPRQQLFDADSLGRGNAKEIIDAIVAVGFLPDDGPRFVTQVDYRQDATRRADGPSTEVTITEAPA